MTHENTAVREGRAHLVLAALAAALLVLAAVPALASAAGIEINSLNDSPQLTPGPNCNTGLPEGENCTLRAAIEAANFEPDASVIEFPESIFEGGQQIKPGTALPAITAPVTIFAHLHSYASYKGPGVGVTAPAGAPALSVQSEGVTVKGIAFGGGRAGIEVLGAKGFLATGDWFGLDVTGTAAPIQGAGIVVGSGAELATIGAAENEAEARNVFTNAEAGVEVIGASKTKILGNYIGLKPDGTGPATLEEGVVIHDSLTAKAEETEVGGALTPSEAATPLCDGACNAIAVEGSAGIGVLGKTAAAGHGSRIRGNFVGLAANGVTPVGQQLYGVAVASTNTCGGGPEVTVGGASPAAGNYIVGGLFGIYAEGAERFTAARNAIGIAADGEPSTSPNGVGITICAEGVSTTANVTGNRIALDSGPIGIVSSWGRAQIVENSIEGGTAGIVTNEKSEGHGDLIQGNSISGVDREGIEIGEESESNVVIGNTIAKAGWVGLHLDRYADHNRIGGDAQGEANTFIEDGLRGEPEDGAISVSSRRLIRNEFAANTGFANNGAFIKLGPNPIEGEIPNGIAPPTLGLVRQSSASGITAPEATVRIYAKASAEPGELGAQLAVVKADSAGAWKATYAKQVVGGLVTATATREGGTSEVATPVAASADPEESGGGGGGGGGNSGGGGSSGSGSNSGSGNPSPPPAQAVAKVAPVVKIIAGPKKTTEATSAKFKFKATNVAGAKFECKLDGAKWAKCTSPKAYKKLKPGKHTFRVRATADGLTGAVVRYRFKVGA